MFDLKKAQTPRAEQRKGLRLKAPHNRCRQEPKKHFAATRLSKHSLFARSRNRGERRAKEQPRLYGTVFERPARRQAPNTKQAPQHHHIEGAARGTPVSPLEASDSRIRNRAAA